MAKEYLDKDGLLYFWQKIKNTFALASHTHTVSNISDFPSTMTPSSHTHGNITNDGKLQTSDVDIANGDKLVIADSSDSSKMARASLAFDGSTTTKVLAKKGDWIDLPSGASPSSTTPAMDGTASVGTETAFARGDHVHPTDTSRAPNTTFTAATSSVSGADGLVPAPAYNGNRNDYRVLLSNATWAGLGVNTVRGQNGVMQVQLYRMADGGDVKAPITQHTLDEATSSANGLMSRSDKTKLDSLTITNGVIDPSNLPSFVDDVIEAFAVTGATPLSAGWLTKAPGFPAITPESGKIYVLMADSGDYAANTQFRWGGTAYVKLADGGVSSVTNAEIDTIVAS